VVFDVTAETTPLTSLEQGITAVSRADGQFLNAYSGEHVTARTGADLVIPVKDLPLALSYTLTGITRTLTGEPLDVLYANEENEVQAQLVLTHTGDTILDDTQIVVPVDEHFTLTAYPDAVVPTTAGFLWNVGEIRPGQNRRLDLSCHASLPNPPTREGEWPIFAPATANFFYRDVTGMLSLDLAASLTHPFLRIDHHYLPLVTIPYQAPDLVVTAVGMEAGEVTVTIANVGDTAVTAADGFWVDLYVTPTPAPQAVNEIWHDGRSDYGAAWAVTADLAPGATLTLRPGDAYYASDRTHLPSAWSPGLLLYAQVDSYAPGMPHGAIPEQDELNGNDYNNILGPVPLP
jgi:hypothetical protein